MFVLTFPFPYSDAHSSANNLCNSADVISDLVHQPLILPKVSHLVELHSHGCNISRPEDVPCHISYFPSALI